jgi:hypothetical protein
MANNECILEASVTEGDRSDLNSPEDLKNAEKSSRALTKLEREGEDEICDETFSQHSRVPDKGRFVGQLVMIVILILGSVYWILYMLVFKRKCYLLIN